jgi:8-oxo-dGTP pyrophosphatase MutT (NUDIX family)
MKTAIDILQGVEKGKHANVRPKDAATLIILDRTGSVPKVLMGRRHEGHVFMPGRFVFPGGRLESGDMRMTSASEIDAVAAAKLMLGTTALKARALALAAIRETFEETGLMLGVKRSPPPSSPGAIWSAFAQAGVHPHLAALHFVARAITPPRFARRFDTRFFAVDAEAITHRVDDIVGPDAELVELVWTPIAETKQMGLHPITALILEELEARSLAGFGHDLPVPFFRMKNRRFTRELL